ncbi:MAG: glycosyltransferase [Candidatus Marinimicrobia bacterium]|nr:glycosyltransferase [Candidatus Neomarinimicrobiota bacterium]
MHLTVYIITAIAYAFAGCYVLYILFFYTGLRKLKAHKLKEDADLPDLTVIVCAKDEEANIENCLNSIFSQDYPKDKFSVIAVNDRSKDRTQEILEKFAHEYGQLEILNIETCPAGISPKKNAITHAMEFCNTEFVVATDADALHKRNWLRTYGSLCDENLGAATGISLFSKEKYDSKFEQTWQSMQTLENLSHNVVIAGAMANGFGITANGSNMLYKKDLFQDQKALKNNVVTGDDSDIIYEAQKRGYKVVFNSHPGSVVNLVPETNIKGVINQRIRWASHVMKATFSVIALGLTVFFFYLATLFLPFLAFIDLLVLPYWLGLIFIKAACDFFYMNATLKKFEIPYKFKHLFYMEIFHSLFIVWIGLYGTFGTFTWKGSSYKKTLKDK